MSTDGLSSGKNASENPEKPDALIPVTNAPGALQQSTHTAAIILEWKEKSQQEALTLGLGLEGEFPVAQEFESAEWIAAKKGLGDSLFSILQKARTLGQLSEENIMRYVAFVLAGKDAPSLTFRILNNAKLGTPQLRLYFAERSFQRIRASRGDALAAGELATLFGHTTDEYRYFVAQLAPVPPKPVAPVMEVQEDDDYDDDEKPVKRFPISLETHISDLWGAASSILGEERFKHLDDDIADDYEHISDALMDSRDLEISVRDFCARYDVDVDELVSLFPVYFIDPSKVKEGDEEVEMPTPIELSVDISMVDMWRGIHAHITEEQEEAMIADIYDALPSAMAVLLIVDGSTVMNMSVRAFCSQVHKNGANDLRISLEDLEELLYVRFTDKPAV